MKKYIAPEVSLIKELANDFCEGVIDPSITSAEEMGYVQLENVSGEMEE